jgi:hypothetical protein
VETEPASRSSTRGALLAAISCCALGFCPTGGSAQLESAGRVLDESKPILLAVDTDDDDDDGVVDLAQTQRVPTPDLVEIMLQVGNGGDVEIGALGGLRVLRNGLPLALPVTIAALELPTPLSLQATRASSSGHPVALLVTQRARALRIPVHAVELTFLNAENLALDASHDTLGLSLRVTNDSSLPRVADYDVKSPDPNNLRVQILDGAAPGKRIRARLQSLPCDGSRPANSIALTLVRPRSDMPFRSRFIRLVGDAVDLNARGVGGQVLRVGLRDQVRIVYDTRLGRVQQTLRVGRPGDERGASAARHARLSVTVLRAEPGGRPVIGVDDLSALHIVRDELEIANEIWLQCHLTLGPPGETSVQIVDPPGPTLLAVADGDGLPAAGGVIRLRIDGRNLGPIEIPRGSTPQATALRIEAKVRAAGFQATVTVNPPAVFGASPGADLLVRAGDGRFVHLEAIPDLPMTTDLQQRISIGSVDLGDGLEEFDNMIAQSGTLEERTLIKALSDEDPATIDLFIINRFTHGTRQGEAFIAASSGAIVNTLVLDRNGLRQRQTAWTLAHELGHVLLNQPLHPDNVGADAPALLMDSDNNRGTVNGPKRLQPSECLRMRHEGEKRSVPPLLQPYDARPNRAAPAAGAPPAFSASACSR